MQIQEVFIYLSVLMFQCINSGLSWWLRGEESACSAGDLNLIPGLGRTSGEGNDNSLHHSCLENSMDRDAWQAVVHRVTKSSTQLSDFHFQIQHTVFSYICISVSAYKLCLLLFNLLNIFRY